MLIEGHLAVLEKQLEDRIIQLEDTLKYYLRDMETIRSNDVKYHEKLEFVTRMCDMVNSRANNIRDNIIRIWECGTIIQGYKQEVK